MLSVHSPAARTRALAAAHAVQTTSTPSTRWTDPLRGRVFSAIVGPRRALTLAVAIALTAAPMTCRAAFGTTDQQSPAIHVCENTQTGALRQVGLRTVCRSTERAEHWDTGSAVPAVQLTSAHGTGSDKATVTTFELVSMPLQAGMTYQVTALVDINTTGTPTDSVQCYLTAHLPTTPVDVDSSSLLSGVSRVTLQGQITVLQAGTVELDCMNGAGGWFADPHIDAVATPTS